MISDQYLGPEIPGVIQFDFDFTYRTRVTADAIVNGRAYVLTDDHVDPQAVKTGVTAGVTALEDQRIMESYAAEMKRRLAGKIVPEVDCNEPTVLLNMLEKNGAKYLVVVNDKRTYGERLGKFKSALEKIVPQTVAIDLKRWAGAKPCVYDMLARRELSVAQADGGYRFTVELSDLGGTVIALYPHRIRQVSVRAAEVIKAGTKQRVSIAVIDDAGQPAPGLQPLEVIVSDPSGKSTEYGDYYCAKNGALDIDFMPALNDTAGRWQITIVENTAGLKANAAFTLVQ